MWNDNGYDEYQAWRQSVADRVVQLNLRSLDGIQRVERIADIPIISGVYFLFHNGSLRYIGQTVNLQNRWRGHAYKQFLTGGELRWVEERDRDARELMEHMCILRFKPFFNNGHSPHSAISAALQQIILVSNAKRRKGRRSGQ